MSGSDKLCDFLSDAMQLPGPPLNKKKRTKRSRDGHTVNLNGLQITTEFAAQAIVRDRTVDQLLLEIMQVVVNEASILVPAILEE